MVLIKPGLGVEPDWDRFGGPIARISAKGA